jgi:hypothetical protein
MSDTLRESRYCRYVVFMQVDAGFKDLRLPIEWIFNRWQVSKSTTLAFASLPSEEDSCMSRFTIAHVTSHTKKLIDTWSGCLDDSLDHAACQTWRHAMLWAQKSVSLRLQSRQSRLIKVLCDEVDMFRDCAQDVCIGVDLACASMFLREQKFSDHNSLSFPKINLEEAMVDKLAADLLQSSRERANPGRERKVMLDLERGAIFV